MRIPIRIYFTGCINMKTAPKGGSLLLQTRSHVDAEVDVRNVNVPSISRWRHQRTQHNDQCINTLFHCFGLLEPRFTNKHRDPLTKDKQCLSYLYPRCLSSNFKPGDPSLNGQISPAQMLPLRP